MITGKEAKDKWKSRHYAKDSIEESEKSAGTVIGEVCDEESDIAADFVEKFENDEQGQTIEDAEEVEIVESDYAYEADDNADDELYYPGFNLNPRNYAQESQDAENYTQDYQNSDPSTGEYEDDGDGDADADGYTTGNDEISYNAACALWNYQERMEWWRKHSKTYHGKSEGAKGKPSLLSFGSRERDGCNGVEENDDGDVGGGESV